MVNTNVVLSDGSLYSISQRRVLRLEYSKHTPMIKSVKNLKMSLRAGKYAWPGGYEVFFLTYDGEVMCYDCVLSNFGLVAASVKAEDHSDWRVLGMSTTEYEDDGDVCECCHCGRDLNPTEQQKDKTA